MHSLQWQMCQSATKQDGEVSAADGGSAHSSLTCTSPHKDSDNSSPVAASSWMSEPPGATAHVPILCESELVSSSRSTTDTPRKRELKRKVRLKIRQCQRMRSRLSAALKHTTVFRGQSALNKLKPCLSTAAFSLISA